MTIAFQNEFLNARLGESVMATRPDLITLLDAETGEPITTESMRYGFRVIVLAMPGEPRWRSPRDLEVVEPGCFGYDVPFIPVEERLAQDIDPRGEAA